MATREKWANQQIAIAIELGMNPLDAQVAMRALLAMVPADPARASVDPATVQALPAGALVQDIARAEFIADARADWYAKVESRYARLLDATGEE